MNFIFDVDDTLYNQITPFLEAYQTVGLDKMYDINTEELFIRSRAYSEEVFGQVSKGLMSVEESGVYRIQKAFLDEGINLAAGKALAVQQQYAKYQKQIKLSDTLHEILVYLKEHNSLIGVITNGPLEHQQSKVNALKLIQYMPKENIFISGRYGINKPDKRLFEICENQLDIQKENTYYIGDSYENDVLGANGAGWKSIYLNRRGYQHHQGVSLMATTEEELKEIIIHIVETSEKG